MSYFEETSVFAYKVKTNEKFKWRVSVDLGIHSFLLMVMNEVSKIFTLGATHKVPTEIVDKAKTLVSQAVAITSDLNGCELIIDECHLAALTPAERDFSALINEIDKGTTYSSVFWSALLDDIKKLEVSL